MDTRTVLEIFGWASTALIIASLIVPDQRTFRWWNLIGSFIAAAYNSLLEVWPAVATNGIIVLIDVYWLWRLGRPEAAAIARPSPTVESASAG